MTVHFNHIRGCTKVSPACTHCYAETLAKRNSLMLGVWGDNGTRVVASEDMWKQPLKWNSIGALASELWEACKSHRADEVASGQYTYSGRSRVFCASLADVFEDWGGPIRNHKGERLFWSHSRQPHESKWHWITEANTAGGETSLSMRGVRQRLFDLIDDTSNLDWLLLTKRPENIRRMWQGWQGDLLDWRSDAKPKYRENVWLGTTVENQEYADKRIPELLKCRDLSPVLFLSCEPLLGPLELAYPESMYPDGPDYCCSGFECGCYGLPIDPPAWLGKFSQGVDWVIVGCESGPHRRKTELDWVRSLRDQCQAAGVAFFVKQLEVDGKVTDNIEDFPVDLRIQEFPHDQPKSEIK